MCMCTGQILLLSLQIRLSVIDLACAKVLAKQNTAIYINVLVNFCFIGAVPRPFVSSLYGWCLQAVFG